jgi:hypothetical protein
MCVFLFLLISFSHPTKFYSLFFTDFNKKMKEMELQMLAMSDAMTAKMKDMMTLLSAGVLIERRDHAHKLRYVAYKNWAHTIPMWRCSTCATDFNKTDKALAKLEPAVYVCNEQYEAMMVRDDDDEVWNPPAGCDFALCAKCVRNQEPIPTKESKKRKLQDKKIEKLEKETEAATKKEEEELDAQLIVDSNPEMSTEMSTEDMFAALNDGDSAPEGSLEDMYKMLND